MLKTIYRHKPDLVTRNIGNESVIVPLCNNVAEMDILYTLNETGVFIWEHVNGENDIKAIIDAIVKEFSVEEQLAQKDVCTILKQMEGKIIEIL